MTVTYGQQDDKVPCQHQVGAHLKDGMTVVAFPQTCCVASGDADDRLVVIGQVH